MAQQVHRRIFQVDPPHDHSCHDIQLPNDNPSRNSHVAGCRRSGNALQAQQEWIKQLARSANADDASRITVRPPASGVF